jgi:hypothetical protein
MACDLAAGRAFPCKDAIGGIKEVLWCKEGSMIYDPISGGAVSDIDGTATLFRWAITKNSGSFQQEITSSVENGTIFFTQTLTIQTPKLEALVSEELYAVLQSRLQVIVRDNNDNFHIMGYSRGVEVTGGNFGTGTAPGDLNGYNIVFTAEEPAPAPFTIDWSNATAVGGLTGNFTVSPAY